AERRRQTYVGIRKTRLPTIMLEGKGIVGIIETRCKSLRFEEHSLRHVRSPELHRPTEDAVIDAFRAKMRGDGEPIGASTDDRDGAGRHRPMGSECLGLGTRHRRVVNRRSIRVGAAAKRRPLKAWSCGRRTS